MNKSELSIQSSWLYRDNSLKGLDYILSNLIRTYRQSSNDNATLEIFTVVRVVIKRLSEYYFSDINHLYDTDEFSTEVALDFLAHLYSGDINSYNPVNFINNLCRRYVRNENKVHTHQRFDTKKVKPNIDDEINIRKTFDKYTKDLPDRFKSLVFYYLIYEDEVNKLYRYFDDLTVYVVDSVLTSIKKELLHYSNMSNENIKVPENQTSKVIFLSSLYKQNSASLVFFLMMQDMESLYQFCRLFGGQEIRFPTVDELDSIFKNTSQLVDKFEHNENLSIKDQETLAYLSTNIDFNNLEEVSESTDLIPFVEDYLSSIVQENVKAYGTLLDRMIENTDVSDIEKASKSYNKLNKEIKLQIKLISDIVKSISSVNKINEAIEKIKTEKDEESSEDN